MQLGPYKQVAELTASGAAGGNALGRSVAVTGGTVVVGANGHDGGAGAGYVFTQVGTGWRQAILTGTGAVVGDLFGQAVAVSGGTIVAGAVGYDRDMGRAFVFTRTVGGWSRTGDLVGSGTSAFSYFGQSVGVSGPTVVVGANGYGAGTGRAYVFSHAALGWHQVAELVAPGTATGDLLGQSVAISGTTIVVGAVGHANGSGLAYVFTKRATGWARVAELVGSDTKALDQFGFSVAISGTTVVVGAIGHANGSGRAYVFTKGPTGWHQVAEWRTMDNGADESFGESVAISGPVVVVGAPGQAKGAGLAYVFTEGPTGWHQVAQIKGDDTAAGDSFGGSVAASANAVVVGAWRHAVPAGSVYIFKR
jgi:hypothetical protein